MPTLTINELYDFRDHMKMDIMQILMTVNFKRICWINFYTLSILFFFLFFQNKGDVVICFTFMFLPIDTVPLSTTHAPLSPSSYLTLLLGS